MARSKLVKTVKVGRNCDVSILRRDSQWTPFSVVTYDGRGFKMPFQGYNMDDARAAAAAQVRKLRRTDICRRGGR